MKQGNEGEWGLGSGWANNKHVSDVKISVCCTCDICIKYTLV
ncbi:unnamed protein product [Arabidopsis halleri]